MGEVIYFCLIPYSLPVILSCKGYILLSAKLLRVRSASIVRGIFDITEKTEAAHLNCGDELALDGDTEALAACRGSQSPR